MLPFSGYIISLSNRVDRINSMEHYYSKYMKQIDFFYGVSKEELKKHKEEITTGFCNKFCTTPIVGCASSHILLWKKISEQTDEPNKPFLILEDDTFIDLERLSGMYKEIQHLNSRNKNVFLQIVGEGVYLKKRDVINGIYFDQYKFHVFLGAYMITPTVAKFLFETFKKSKISYHIDYSLNNVKGLNKYILNDAKIGTQNGLLDSNMSSSYKTIIGEKYQRLFYALSLPIISVNNIIVNLMNIILVIFLVIAVIMKNPLLFCLGGIFVLDFIRVES